MKIDYTSNTLKFEDNRESFAIRLALDNYKHHLESEGASNSINSKLRTVSNMLDEFEFMDDIIGGE